MSGPDPQSRWTDEHVEMLVGNLLRYGVLAAAAIALVGGVLYLARYGGTHADYHLFRGQPAELKSVGGVIGSARTGDGRGIIQLGLLALIATPIARVAFSLLAFARQRDRTYVIITAIVLALLLYGLTGYER